MESFLKALTIFSDSWPLTFMVLGVVGGLAVTLMVRSTNRASVQRRTIEAEKELELKRLSADLHLEDDGKRRAVTRRPEDY